MFLVTVSFVDGTHKKRQVSFCSTVGACLSSTQSFAVHSFSADDTRAADYNLHVKPKHTSAVELEGSSSWPRFSPLITSAKSCTCKHIFQKRCTSGFLSATWCAKVHKWFKYMPKMLCINYNAACLPHSKNWTVLWSDRCPGNSHYDQTSGIQSVHTQELVEIWITVTHCTWSQTVKNPRNILFDCLYCEVLKKHTLWLFISDQWLK